MNHHGGDSTKPSCQNCGNPYNEHKTDSLDSLDAVPKIPGICEAYIPKPANTENSNMEKSTSPLPPSERVQRLVPRHTDQGDGTKPDLSPVITEDKPVVPLTSVHMVSIPLDMEIKRMTVLAGGLSVEYMNGLKLVVDMSPMELLTYYQNPANQKTDG